MKKHKLKLSQRGQVLVLVAVALIGMLAILALVLDGGNTYAKRRQAQNAADAGALAGATTLCRGTAAEAIAAANDYAVNRNGAASAVVSIVDSEVTVDTSIPFDTFFLSVFGRPQITAQATATAGCFSPGSGLGILPIAWSCRPPEIPPVGPLDPACSILFEDETDGDDDCTFGVDPIYIIVDSADIENDLVCEDPPPAPGDPPALGFVDCDLDDDGTNDLDVLSGGNRSWLDLNGGGGGAADLRDWITNGFPGEVYTHTWFAGQTGVAVSVYDTVHDEVLVDDEIVIIPVFDQFCGGPPDTTCPELVHTDPPDDFDDTIVFSGGASTDYFHVISFALFKISCVDAGSHPGGGSSCPGNQQLQDWNIINPSGKTIEGCFIQGTVPGLGGGGGPFVGAYVVYLTR
jgi:type II secretory pathway pseudopilin PulG